MQVHMLSLDVVILATGFVTVLLLQPISWNRSIYANSAPFY